MRSLAIALSALLALPVVAPACSDDAGSPGLVTTPVEVTDAGDVHALALSSGALYWVAWNADAGRSELWRRAPDGTPEQLASVTDDTQWDRDSFIAVTLSHVFWTAPRASGLWRTHLVTGVHERAPGVTTPSGLAAATDHVYFTLHNEGRVERIGLNAPSPLTKASVLDFATLEFPTGVAAAGGKLFVIDRLAAVLLRFEFTAGQPVMHASWHGDNTVRLDASASDLVWSNNATGELLTVPVAGGDVRTILSAGVAMGASRVVTSQWVYMVTPRWETERPLRRVPLAGGTPEVVAPCATAVAADGDRVAYATCDGRIVTRQ